MIPAPLADVVSPEVGLVPRIERCLAGTAEARFHTSICALAEDERLLDSPLTHVESTSGFGRSQTSAAAAAVGEAVERYSASFVPRDRLAHATASELGPGAVDPGRFALFAGSQYGDPDFPFRRFDAETRVPWARGRELRSGRPAWLPAELVYLGEVPDAAPIGYATSSGAACAPSEDEAVLRGLLELLERDAFVILWRCRLSLPLLDWRTHTKLRALEARYFAPSGLRYAAVDLSAFHRLPSVLGVVRSPGLLAVGAGTAATVTHAWWKALSEAFAAHAAARRLRVVEPDPPAADEVRSFGDHIRWFAGAERVAAADFLDASSERVDVRDVPRLAACDTAAAVCELLERIERSGSSAYAVDVTAPDVAELGLRVVKTLAPELCQLDAPHRFRFLGGPRLLRAAFELGLAVRPLRFEELNPDPHPFP